MQLRIPYGVDELIQIPRSEYDRLLESEKRLHALSENEEASRTADHETVKRLAELAAVVESSDDVILSKDLNGIITSWNAAATRLFGYTADEIIGKSILMLIPEHLHSDEEKILSNVRVGRRIDHFETFRKTKDGRLIEVSLTVSPVTGVDGKIVGASKILRDISVQKRIEQSLIQAEKLAATGRMAATIAHEVNNPLEGAINLIYLAKTNAERPDVIRYLETAETELLRVSHIAKQTLGYYREHAEAKGVAFRDLITQTMKLYMPRARSGNVDVQLELKSEQRLVVRQGEMIQVISNLVMNSIYAMASGGTLSISLNDTEDPDGVIMSVKDSGAGISETDMPRVFEAFFTTRRTIGTGIGLFVSRQFVEGHGGTIRIKSSQSEEDHGTTVEVFLPARTVYET